MLALCRDILKRWGPAGLVVGVVLLLALQQAGLLPAAYRVANFQPDSASNGQPESRDRAHAREMDRLAAGFEALQAQLTRNHETLAVGLRTLCITSARTDDARLRCADIK